MDENAKARIEKHDMIIAEINKQARTIAAQAETIRKLTAALKSQAENADAMLYLFDRGITENMIGRHACDNLRKSTDEARALLGED